MCSSRQRAGSNGPDQSSHLFAGKIEMICRCTLGNERGISKGSQRNTASAFRLKSDFSFTIRANISTLDYFLMWEIWIFLHRSSLPFKCWYPQEWLINIPYWPIFTMLNWKQCWFCIEREERRNKSVGDDCVHRGAQLYYLESENWNPCLPEFH